jgi:uncharacterized protein
VTAPTSTEPHRDPADRWPAFFALLGFVLALTAALVLAILVSTAASIITGTADPDDAGVTLAATLLQDAAFVLSAIWLARQVSRPRARDFGLRPAPLRRAVAWTLVLGAGFYAISALYSALLDPEAEQQTLDTLGVDEGVGFLIASAVVVVVLAPFAEEFLFRGFMYRALRNRLRPIVAAIAIGAIFGSIHYSGPETLELIPLLALLGFVFCVLYERTGSLYPAIALHAFNNALAFAVTADEDGAVVVAGATLLVATALCLGLPARQVSAGRA